MFIPEMLKFSTCRSKPGWNKPEYKPPWWPDEAPWANVRCDMRTDEQKKQVMNFYYEFGYSFFDKFVRMF